MDGDLKRRVHAFGSSKHVHPQRPYRRTTKHPSVFSPIPNLLLLKPAKSSSADPKSLSCHRHQHRVIQFTAPPTRTQVQLPAWQQHPTVSTVQPTFKIASTPTPSRSFANMSQAVQFCALLEKSPGRFYGLLRSARLQICVKNKKTPSLTERSRRTSS